MSSKIAMIGAGFVGAAASYAIALSGITSDLVLIDVLKEKAMGEALDIGHTLQFIKDMKIRSGDMDEISDADIIVITAGTARKPGETRLDLLKRNVGILRNSIIPEMKKHYKDSIILVVANPVDILAYFTQKDMGLPTGKVISSGTNLDTMRLVYRLSEVMGVSTKSITAYILGEHGESAFAAWSSANVAGRKLSGELKEFGVTFDDASKDQIMVDVKNGGASIIKNKGATYYGIGVSIVAICRGILFDEKVVLPVGTMMDGLYGVTDVNVSMPSVIGRRGVEKVVDIGLSDAEAALFRKSADVLKQSIKEVLEA